MADMKPEPSQAGEHDLPAADEPAEPAVANAEPAVANAEPVELAAGPAEPAVANAEPATLSEPAPTSQRRWRAARRFAVAFLFGVLGVLAVSAGALAAFESSNAGRIMPGVHVGTVDLSGLSAGEARARLNAAYASLGDGELVLVAGETTRTVSYASVGRRLDVDAVVDAALAVGRSGATIDRIAANLRNFVRGIDLAPQVTFEPAAVRVEVQALAASVDQEPASASVAISGSDVVVTDGQQGRVAEVDQAVATASDLIGAVDAPDQLTVTMTVDTVEPEVTTAEAQAAATAARRIASDLELVSANESWTIPAATIRGWISFGSTADGGYGPIVATEGIQAGLTPIADAVRIAPVDASYTVGDSASSSVGVVPATEGRELDVAGLVASLSTVMTERAHGLAVARLPIATTVVEPTLTTAEAEATAPLMKPVSSWTTYFPVGISNGQGANIWIPAKAINGYVLQPGAWFDFWKAIGPVTREAGYKDGGAIINGKTEPTGALAGGICSCSTTLFNAALRAGLEMGDRRNHYYYISRYPLGLDATVFQSSSGSIQTMSFRNDTDYPVLIRSKGWKSGSRGYVEFVLWTVPTGRTVTIGDPVVKNVKVATDSVQYTSDLAPGVRQRVEYPTDGKDVWRTITVKDAEGNVIRQTTYYSHYSRVNGLVLVGAEKSAATPGP